MKLPQAVVQLFQRVFSSTLPHKLPKLCYVCIMCVYSHPSVRQVGPAVSKSGLHNSYEPARPGINYYYYKQMKDAILVSAARLN